MSERRARHLCVAACCTVLIWMATGCSSSKPAPAAGFEFVSPTSTPTLDLGESINLTVNQSATWSLQSGCLDGKPAGTFAGGVMTATGATATYVAPSPQASGICSQDVVVANASNQSAVLAVNLAALLNVSNASQLSYSSLGCTSGPCCPPAGTLIPASTGGVLQVGAFEQFGPITASGGVPPYTWQVLATSNSLPGGLQLAVGTDTSQLLITGTPNSPGCSAFTLQLNDSTATSNCNPQTSAACSQATINIVVVPPSLKVQVPSYASALSDPQNGDRGAPYPPLAMQASGGLQPYFWCQDPVLGSIYNPSEPNNLPPGLTLNGKSAANFTCGSVVPMTTSNSNAVSTSGFAVISGVPATGDELPANASGYCQSAGGGAGCFTTQFQVYDNETPYPALGFATLANMQDLPVRTCSQANQPPPVSGSSISPDAYLTGPTAFLLRGFDANGPVVIGGSVSLDGAGNASGGTVDVTRSSGHTQYSIQSTGSWYVVGTTAYGTGEFGNSLPPGVINYSRGCMNLALSNSGNPAPPISFAFTLGGCTNRFTNGQVVSTSASACGVSPTDGSILGTFTTGRIIEFDDNTGNGTRASGVLRAQSSDSFATGLSGSYAFGLSGGDSVAKHYATAGYFLANSGALTSVTADVNDGGTCGSNSTCNTNSSGGSGTYTIDSTFGSTNGRWTGTVGVNSQTTLGFALYLVSPNEALAATTDLLAAGHPILGGEAITTASSFNSTVLQNTHMLHIGGLASSGPDVSVGVLAFDGEGNITSGTVYQDQSATLGTTPASGVYQIDSNTGRAVFSAPNAGQTLGAHNFVGYIIPPPSTLTRADCSTPAACITGFLIGTDNTAQSGVLEFQSSVTAPPPPFSNLFVGGDYAYGTDEILDPTSANVEGDVFATPVSTSSINGNLGTGNAGSLVQDIGSSSPAFEQDSSYGDTGYYCLRASNCYLLQPNQLLTGTYTVSSSGTGTLGGGTVAVTNGNVTFYIDESPSNTHPTVIVAEQ